MNKILKCESQRKKGSGFGYFFAGLAGAILGALIILFVFPEVGIISNGSNNNNENHPIRG